MLIFILRYPFVPSHSSLLLQFFVVTVTTIHPFSHLLASPVSITARCQLFFFLVLFFFAAFFSPFSVTFEYNIFFSPPLLISVISIPPCSSPPFFPQNFCYLSFPLTFFYHLTLSFALFFFFSVLSNFISSCSFHSICFGLIFLLSTYSCSILFYFTQLYRSLFPLLISLLHFHVHHLYSLSHPHFPLLSFSLIFSSKLYTSLSSHFSFFASTLLFSSLLPPGNYSGFLLASS